MEHSRPAFNFNSTRMSRYGIYIAFVLMFIILSIINKSFLTVDNLVDILKQSSIISIIAVGEVFCLITGGFDLSSGSVMALAGVLAAMLGKPGGPPVFIAFLAALAVGAVCGILNGIAVAKGAIPAFIVTLGMQQAARGMALLVTNATPVFGLSQQFSFLGGGTIGPVPMLVIILIVVFAIFYFILEKTKFGRHVYAIGGNIQSAKVCGINVDRTQILVYTISGILSGLGGLLLAGRLSSGTPTMASGYELNAIAGAVIGGVSTTGGVGRIYGAIIGAVMLTMISNGLDLMNVPSYYQQIIEGAIIVGAVLFDVKSKVSRS